MKVYFPVVAFSVLVRKRFLNSFGILIDNKEDLYPKIIKVSNTTMFHRIIYVKVIKTHPRHDQGVDTRDFPNVGPLLESV